jgi:hypothetical protein
MIRAIQYRKVLATITDFRQLLDSPPELVIGPAEPGPLAGNDIRVHRQRDQPNGAASFDRHTGESRYPAESALDFFTGFRLAPE